MPNMFKVNNKNTRRDLQPNHVKNMSQIFSEIRNNAFFWKLLSIDNTKF